MLFSFIVLLFANIGPSIISVAAFHLFPYSLRKAQDRHKAIPKKRGFDNDANPYDLSYIGKFAAVGDSYAAGLKAGNALSGTGDADCGRYDGSSSVLLSTWLGGESFTNLACSGATTKDVKSKQVASLDDGSQDLITVSAGGNDAGFSDVLINCVYLTTDQASCDKAIDTATSAIKDIASNVDDLLTALNYKLSDSGIIIYNLYAQFWNDAANYCDDKTWNYWDPSGAVGLKLTSANRKAMNQLVTDTNKAIMGAIASAQSSTRASVPVYYGNWDDGVSYAQGHFCEDDSSTDPSFNKRIMFNRLNDGSYSKGGIFKARAIDSIDSVDSANSTEGHPLEMKNKRSNTFTGAFHPSPIGQQLIAAVDVSIIVYARAKQLSVDPQEASQKCIKEYPDPSCDISDSPSRRDGTNPKSTYVDHYFYEQLVQDACSKYPGDIPESFDKTLSVVNAAEGLEYPQYNNWLFEMKWEDKPGVCPDELTCFTIFYDSFMGSDKCMAEGNMATEGSLDLSCGTASYTITVKDSASPTTTTSTTSPSTPSPCPEPYNSGMSTDQLRTWWDNNHCDKSCPDGSIDTTVCDLLIDTNTCGYQDEPLRKTPASSMPNTSSTSLPLRPQTQDAQPADPQSSFPPETYIYPFLKFMTENPTVFHAVDSFSTRLSNAGFVHLSQRDLWTSKVRPGGKYYTTRNGSGLIAFAVGKDYKPGNGVGIVAGHVDALTAKLKPIPEKTTKEGYMQLGVAPYAGALNQTWWDRDLGIGGKILVKNSEGQVKTKLVKLGWPIARIPTLAPHFGSAASGPFNKETQMVPIIGLDHSDILDETSSGHSNIPAGTFASTQPELLVRMIAAEAEIEDYSSIVNWELELFDTQPAQLGGLKKDLIFAGRIDDKLCCYAAIEALVNSPDSASSGIVKMVGCFDDEEIGSLLRQGARSNFMGSTIERICEATASSANVECGANLFNQTLANSFMVSSDVCHAVNPNFLEVHLEHHRARLNVGVAVSYDSNGHMTTDSVSAALLQRVADKCGSTLQKFQIRNDSRSGGTIGPMTSAQLGFRAIDAGITCIPQLSMHSIRATTGSLDPGLGAKLFKGFFDYYESVDKEFAE
ncbi:MAG: hypothetical protein Q9227_004719 [Pyrenula ochraceoflavens]